MFVCVCVFWGAKDSGVTVIKWTESSFLSKPILIIIDLIKQHLFKKKM